VNSSQTKLL